MSDLSHLPGEHYMLEDGSHLVVPAKAADADAVAERGEAGDVAFRLARRGGKFAGLLRPAEGKIVSEEALRRSAGLVALHLRRKRVAFDDKQKETYALLFTVLPGEFPVSISASPADANYAKKRSLRPSAKRSAAQALLAEINAAIRDGQIQDALEKAEEAHALPPRLRRVVAKGVLEEFLKLGKTTGEDQPFYLPTLLAAHKSYRAVLSQLEQYLESDELPAPKGRALLAPVAGDRGEGEHLVAEVLVATGRYVIEMAPGLPHGDIVEAVKEHSPGVLVLTGLVPISLRLATDEHERMKICRKGAKDLIALLKKEGLRERLEVVLVGFAFNSQFGKSAGADAVCRTLWSLYTEFHHRKPKGRGKSP